LRLRSRSSPEGGCGRTHQSSVRSLVCGSDRTCTHTHIT
jgi:hypothetical protein